ncbi:glycosyltransferase family 1 protein [Mucilaginibacter limnophilus]|uniref:Glycosyltransferase family 1 protein n=1 Tax=Mucilaginibacter limnophilus TaxID=1932778 RepID=A0A3S2Y379_9SPHI|nr:glycosyltransferase family 1 protein [Mucilaginibacter limnophilus]RVU02465.1 glycosyltransferase family 1 protein [Mucilaginibacter limnophilus]
MQIYINGKFLTQPTAGVQRYAFELTLCLIQKLGNVKILVPKTFNTRRSKIPARNFIKTGNYKNLNIWEQVHLPVFLYNKNALLVNFCNTAPVLVKNKIVCLHDIAFFQNPEWYSKSFYLYYKFLIPKIINSSRHIFTVSEFSKKEIAERFGLNDESISVVYNAPAQHFICPTVDQLEIVKEDFFLFVGSFDPRKNLKTLLQAFASPQLKSKKLIVVGKKWDTFKSEAIMIPPNVTWLDDCSDDLLSYLYRRASALINCSLYEGFGLPLIEAMASGCPLLLSDIPVFREVAGTHASYFNPLNVNSIVEAISVIDERDADIIKYSIVHNYHKSFQFSWKKSSDKLSGIIAELTEKQMKQFSLTSTL